MPQSVDAGGQLSIQVWDTGPGIAAEDRDEIFQEFAQLQPPAHESAKRLGLGLAIVRRIASLLGHPLVLESTPGRGSVFAIEVPVTTPSTARKDLSLPALVLHDFTGVRVGIVDDETAIREAMSDLPHRWGCIVEAADSGAALLERIVEAGADPDLLICDYRLGRSESGLEVIAAICKRVGRNVPALLVTGDTAAPQRKETHGSGYYLLHKPVAPAKLRQAMHFLLRGTHPTGGNT